jgi:hypothetical protein
LIFDEPLSFKYIDDGATLFGLLDETLSRRSPIDFLCPKYAGVAIYLIFESRFKIVNQALRIAGIIVFLRFTIRNYFSKNAGVSDYFPNFR